jgi:hypothetical protein
MLLAGNLASFCQRAVNGISCSGEADVGASLLKSYQVIKQRAGRYSNRRVALGSEVQGMTRLLVVEDARRRRTRSRRHWAITLRCRAGAPGREGLLKAATERMTRSCSTVCCRVGMPVVRDGSSFAGLF